MRISKFLICFFLCAYASAAPTLRVSKSVSLMDEELSIEIKGALPFQHVALKAETIDAAGEKWSSEAIFCSDERGRVRLTRNAPLEGSYAGVDGMGLFWSLRPESKEQAIFKIPDTMFINLTLVIDRHPVAAKEIQRLKKRRDIKRTVVKEKGLVGVLYSPPSKHPLPVVITLEGGNGGMGETRAQLLSSHGFAVLALAYFGEEGLPSRLENIPLEYFKTAFEWLKSRPEIDDNNIGLLGISRGAELALLMGTLFPETINAIAAAAPSSITLDSFDSAASAWTYQGKPITGFSLLSTFLSAVAKEDKSSLMPLKTAPLFLKAMENKESWQSACIPIEKIRCPILLLSGGDDHIWPATIFSNQIKERLASKGAKTYCRHHNYPKAGHNIYLPFLPSASALYHPFSKKWLSMGGTAQENNRASADAWKKTVVFFQNKLKNRIYENP